MEDYDVSEIKNITNKILLAVEDDEKYILNNIINKDIELMPLRFSYDISNFSKEYIDSTKKLFSFYSSNKNSHKNELLRLKKHFKHYMREPLLAYIPNKINYKYIIDILDELKIEHVSSLELAVKKINNVNKIFFVDIDDTLRNSSGEITTRTKEAISDTIKLGNKVVLTTARPGYYAKKVSQELNINNVIISSNGANIFEKNKQIFSYYIDKKNIYEIVDYAFENNIRVILSSKRKDYVTKEIRNKNQVLISKEVYKKKLKNINIITCMIIDSNKEKVNKLKEIVKNNINITIVDEKESNDNWIEEWFSIGNSNCSKGSAILKIADYYNIPYKNTVCIGNGINDISMFKNCGKSIAVNNASNEIKNMVDEITLSNDEDGVAISIEKYSK